MPQSKKIEVKHRDRILRRMTVIRCAIFPATRRRKEY